MSRRIVFLCSGGGGNLRFIAEAAALGVLPNTKISAVFTDRECLANRFAYECGFPTQVLNFSGYGQEEVVKALDGVEPDLVVTNVHKILAAPVVDAYRGRLVNLHYSLLPAYGAVIGVRPVEMALAAGVKFIGVTVHDVEMTVDAGRPIVQAVIPTLPLDSVASIMDTVFRCGCLALLEALRDSFPPEGSSAATGVRIGDRVVCFNPGLSFTPDLFDELFWHRLAVYPESGNSLSTSS